MTSASLSLESLYRHPFSSSVHIINWDHSYRVLSLPRGGREKEVIILCITAHPLTIFQLLLQTCQQFPCSIVTPAESMCKTLRDQQSTFWKCWLLANSFHTLHVSPKLHQESLEGFPGLTFHPKSTIHSPCFSPLGRAYQERAATGKAGSTNTTLCFFTLITLGLIYVIF